MTQSHTHAGNHAKRSWSVKVTNRTRLVTLIEDFVQGVGFFTFNDNTA